MKLNDKAKILIVDDDFIIRQISIHALREGGMDVVEAEDGLDAIEKFVHDHYDLVLMDANMPKMDGFDACRAIKKINSTVPVIMITGMEDDKSINRAFDAGAEEFVTKPVNWVILNRRIQMQIANMRSQQYMRLSSRVFETVNDAIMVLDCEEQIINVNPAFSRMSGFIVADVIGKNLDFFHSGRHKPSFFRTMLEAAQQHGHWGGEVWFKKQSGEIFPSELSLSTSRGFDGAITHYIYVVKDISERKLAEAKIYHQANYDGLTDLPNRFLFNENLRRAIALAKREQYPLALLFLDLDGFKWVNDNLGHAAGDEVLRQVSRRISQAIRESDSAARLGGDEFTVILSRVNDQDGAIQSALKLLHSISQPYELTQGGIVDKISVSIGIACYPIHGQEAEKLLRAADKAMYIAKERGKNQIVLHGERGSYS